jgi:hypothetical protein
MGVKGVLPLGCLPFWGREGVTLLYTKEDRQVTGKRGFQQRLKKGTVIRFPAWQLQETVLPRHA